MSKAASAASAKRVTSDWAAVYPGFGQWRPLRLLRRIGPVVQGVTLDRSSVGDRYFPTAHVHALTRKFPVVTMTLGQRLSGASGVQESVGFDEHGEVFRQAADRLREQSWLSLAEPPALEDVVSVYQGYVRRQMELGHPPAVNEAEDCVLLPAAAGLPKLAERSLAIVEEVSANWPPARLPLNWSSRQEWLTELAGKAKNHAELTACVESQIAYHKLDKIPTV